MIGVNPKAEVTSLTEPCLSRNSFLARRSSSRRIRNCSIRSALIAGRVGCGSLRKLADFVMSVPPIQGRCSEHLGLNIGSSTSFRNHYLRNGKFYRPSPARPISCRRSGNLSIARLISRTSQGNGFRSFICPSLSNRTKEKPFGCNVLRHSLTSSGEVSVMTTTSRSISMEGSARSASICSEKAGSFGVSAKTTTGRDSHMKSPGLTSCASYCFTSILGVDSVTSGAASSGLIGGAKSVFTGGGASREGPMAATNIANIRNFNFIGTSCSSEYRVICRMGKDAS